MAKSKILVVDDQKGPRESLRTILRDTYDVTTAEDGASALKSIENKPVDVVLLDKMMPGMDGLDVLQEIRRRWPDTQVIMISADNAHATIIEATKRQAFYYVVKPFDVEQIRHTVAKALDEKALKGEIARLRSSIREEFRFGNIIGNSGSMKRVFETVEQVAKSEATVLILGESGTGKELVARAIHDRSPRQQGPYIPVHCAAIAKDLLESELFGHEKGSFTGALAQRLGMFEAANGGSVFLDEIGEMELGLQAKLLRAIQEREIRRVGGNHTVKVNVRIICATNRNLETEVKQNRFREDLYYRINVVPILIPPLRERTEDIQLLISHFVSRFGNELQKAEKQFSPQALDRMMQYSWPGNVRELEHCIERLMVVVDSDRILPEHLTPILTSGVATSAFPPSPTAREAAPTEPGKEGLPYPRIEIPENLTGLEEITDAIEKQLITNALHESKGIITEAARKLNTTRRVLRYKMDKLGIKSTDDEPAEEAATA